MNKRQVTIATEYIPLGQFLKLAEIIDTGGQAKFFLAETYIEVNGEAENRRGKKLYNGDVVYVEGFGMYEVSRQAEE
ncbi:S4 domain-containing protein YaaA [Aneurinibacillus aneurinilyticus]|jgi:S4 domain protein YaaA|uniref:S4 domain-containing protein YaaA n=2 Tax=Aneurinibacillus aneurinilyticus TaxID=1391 RepID=A0A848CYX6_ANEAE|nr:S4 domain-containing protein YaaA [Aneurinibacillus aneurinilyticus]ERI04876.1 S4 domain protein YaaA [Aneurinibacillus aneurinilyticus ATCC 12856]MCI1693442.1 S4 domain-containing protein YaaA [Aneurinibacillus aneurinilyticus]MED0671507.1 S4 domain-containing protein YaaA [Aneurinibacillus aneurinilyticus]MED0705991.1 S4 domain-containing protein YaaA [Aneurinibacillus aneurinilyticus]MED0721670.1 S4 domain-containing protein YaaA [Aneurinibacillus aneurinilyticus]